MKLSSPTSKQVESNKYQGGVAVLTRKMKQSAVAVMAGLALLVAGQVSAGGSGVAIRVGNSPANIAPKSAGERGRRSDRHFFLGYPYYPYPYVYYPAPVIIAPYPYYGPVTIAVSAPFFCLSHHVGYISRIGMLDHLSGIHKLPLDTAAAVCPDDNQSCIIDGY